MIFDFIQIDKNSTVPMYSQLYVEIKEAVLCGRISRDIRLPSIRAASAELGVSRTTVESAYVRLCNEGFLESRPQSGYFVRTPSHQSDSPAKNMSRTVRLPIKYDFSSGRIDLASADIPIWKKHVRAALNSQLDIISYGEPQGEEILRNVISTYAYAARGVISSKNNIVIGAGTQPLLTLFCSLCNKKTVIAVDLPGFKQAERIFRDFGFQVVYIDPETDIPINIQLERTGASVYLDIPSNKPKASTSVVKVQRAALSSWVSVKSGRFILEDDYNGELRYRARPIPAMQNMDTEHIIYLGSFSKLLLPSVRIAYMVLPESLLSKYLSRAVFYNQTASKIEQIALAEYIYQGHLEKHLRRLKKLYYSKSRCLYSELKDNIKNAREISVLETSLAIILKLDTEMSDDEIYRLPLENGVKLDPVCNKNVKLSFAGIPAADIIPAVQILKKSWDNV